MLDRWAAICRFGGIGDNLIAASALPELAKQYRVEVLSQEPCHTVFENNPHISKLTIKKKGELPEDMLGWQQWFVKRSGEYDLLVNLSHSCESILAFNAGQTQFYWPAAWRRKQSNRNYLEFVHDVVGLPYKFGHSLYFPTDAEHSRAVETKRKVGPRAIGWVLAGSRIDKIYPQAPMAIARLIRELNVPVIVFGAPGREGEMARHIMEHVRRQNGSLDGYHSAVSPQEAEGWEVNKPGEPVTLKKKPDELWPIRRSLAQLQHCDLVIGPDTGPLWSVAMEPMPKIALLSHASPENITKHWRRTVSLHARQSEVPCWPCHQLHDDPATCTPNADNNGAACISAISVETLVENARQLLQ